MEAAGDDADTPKEKWSQNGRDGQFDRKTAWSLNQNVTQCVQKAGEEIALPWMLQLRENSSNADP